MINRDYLYTEFCDVNSHCLETGALFIYEQDAEDRSVYCKSALEANNPSVEFIGIEEQKDDMINIIKDGEQVDTLNLYSALTILTFIRMKKPSCVYLDVTGMNCRVAAPILKVLLEEKIEARVVYAEPSDYIIDAFKKEGLFNEYSETVDGVLPLPGFVNLIPYDEPPVFVALLGFEGWRFAYLVRVQSPLDKKIHPVVGVPGYKMNYPYISLWGNRNVLKEHNCWDHIKYAEANSIVDIYFMLDEIFQDNHNCRMVVAPIGTKPHAIGAIVYAIKHPRYVELLYDNPKRTLHRTEGVGRVSICDVTKLFNS